MPLSKPFAAMALTHAAISLGHTIKGREFMADPQFKRLPRLVSAYARAGWFQGSAWFLAAALINYRWAKLYTGSLTDPLDRAISVISTAVYLFTAAWYVREGDAATGSLLAAGGALSVWSGLLQ